jgi:hypothetical protein
VKAKILMSNLTTESINYKESKIRFKHILLGISLFIVALFLYFPMFTIIEDKVKSTLTRLPGGCSVVYKDSSFSFFFPTLTLNDLDISQRCTGGRSAIKMSKVDIGLSGMSFSPLAPSLHIEPKMPGNRLNIWLAPGLSETSVRLEKTIVSLNDLNKYFNIPLQLEGQAIIDGVTKISGRNLSRLKLLIKSKNLNMPSQMIMNMLQIQQINAGNFLLKASINDGKTLNINELIIGDIGATIRANFKGVIKLDQRNIMNSKLDLKGEIALSDEFLNSNPLFKIALGQFDKKDNFYQIYLRGNFYRPQPSRE